MEDGFDGRDDLRHRLQALGEQPVERELAGRVLQRASGRGRSWWQSTKLKVAAAAAGGFLIGSVGLASAGSLPAPAQDAARSALSTVGISVPPGHDRYNDPAKCPGGPYANHGAYVRAHPNDPNAGASPCGKPNKAVNHPGNGATPGAPDDNGTDNGNGNGGRHGPPPWAHGNKGNKGNNGADDQGDDNQSPPTSAAPAAPAPAAPAPAAPAPNTSPPTTATPTTTAPPATTTTTAAPTTTTAPPTTAAPQTTTTAGP